MDWLSELFKAIGALFNFGQKAIPPDEIRIDNHKIMRDRLVLKERDRIIESCRLWLSVRPKIDIDSYIDWKYAHLNPLDAEELKGILHEMFPHREERTLKYNKILHDTINSIKEKQ